MPAPDLTFSSFSFFSKPLQSEPSQDEGPLSFKKALSPSQTGLGLDVVFMSGHYVHDKAVKLFKRSDSDSNHATKQEESESEPQTEAKEHKEVDNKLKRGQSNEKRKASAHRGCGINGIRCT